MNLTHTESVLARHAILTSKVNLFVDLTNIDAIERLECITVFTEIAS